MIREMMLAAHRRRLTDGSTVYFNIELFNTSSYGKVTKQLNFPSMAVISEFLFIPSLLSRFCDGTSPEVQLIHALALPSNLP